MSYSWLIYYGGENHGPYEVGQIREMHSRGEIPADALYFDEPSHQWKALAELIPPPAEVKTADPAPATAATLPNPFFPDPPVAPRTDDAELTRCYANLLEYLQAKRYYAHITPAVVRAGTEPPWWVTAALVCLVAIMRAYRFGGGGYVNDETSDTTDLQSRSSELEACFAPMLRHTPLVFYKFWSRSVYIRAIVEADDFTEEEILNLGNEFNSCMNATGLSHVGTLSLLFLDPEKAAIARRNIGHNRPPWDALRTWNLYTQVIDVRNYSVVTCKPLSLLGPLPDILLARRLFPVDQRTRTPAPVEVPPLPDLPSDTDPVPETESERLSKYDV